MKPIMMSIIRCIKCKATDDLKLKIEEMNVCDTHPNTTFLRSRLQYFTSNECKNLFALIEEVKKFGDGIKMFDLKYVDRLEEAEALDALSDFLVGNVVSKGCIVCGKCDTTYQLKDGIPILTDDKTL